MKTALINAINAYAELSNMDPKEVATECLKEGAIRESVMMLLFAQSIEKPN